MSATSLAQPTLELELPTVVTVGHRMDLEPLPVNAPVVESVGARLRAGVASQGISKLSIERARDMSPSRAPRTSRSSTPHEADRERTVERGQGSPRLKDAFAVKDLRLVRPYSTIGE